MQVLWRGPDEVQIGIDQPRVLGGLSQQEVELLLRMSRLSERGVQAERRRLGISTQRWRELIRQLPPPPRRWAHGARAALMDQHPITLAAASTLQQAGLPAYRQLSKRSVALLTDPWLTDPARLRELMEADVPFVPVVVGDCGLDVGPAVLPGVTPCPRCRQLARSSADPGWAVVAPQLVGRPTPDLPPYVTELAASVAAHLVLALAAGHVRPGWRIDHLGPRPLPSDAVDCGCGGALTPPYGVVRALA